MSFCFCYLKYMKCMSFLWILDNGAVLSTVFFILPFCFRILGGYSLAFKKATATVNSDACSTKIMSGVCFFFEDVLEI